MKVQFSTINNYSKSNAQFDSNRQNRANSCSFGIEPSPNASKEIAEELMKKLNSSMNDLKTFVLKIADAVGQGKQKTPKAGA